jgi:8-hydroxy-5-deazaflavin:NADPH oxidoreductase
MQIAILGTGAVGPALGKALSAAGHQVTIGTRDPDQTKARDEWADVDLPLAAYQDLNADVFINATNGRGSLAALQAVGDALNGKVVIDTSNALDFSHGVPPSLFVSNTDSLRRAAAARTTGGPASQDVQHHGQPGHGEPARASRRLDDFCGR